MAHIAVRRLDERADGVDLLLAGRELRMMNVRTFMEVFYFAALSLRAAHPLYRSISSSGGSEQRTAAVYPLDLAKNQVEY